MSILGSSSACFVRHKGHYGWITGTADARRENGIYKVYVRYGIYDDNKPWWDQNRQHGALVNLDDIEIISTETAILLGLLRESLPSDQIKA